MIANQDERVTATGIFPGSEARSKVTNEKAEMGPERPRQSLRREIGGVSDGTGGEDGGPLCEGVESAMDPMNRVGLSRSESAKAGKAGTRRRGGERPNRLVVGILVVGTW